MASPLPLAIELGNSTHLLLAPTHYSLRGREKVRISSTTISLFQIWMRRGSFPPSRIGSGSTSQSTAREIVSNSFRIVRHCCLYSAHFSRSSLILPNHSPLGCMESVGNQGKGPAFSRFASSSGGRGRGAEVQNDRNRSRGRGSGSSRSGPGKDKVDALGRLLTRILRHMAAELNLEMRSDGYVKVQDLLQLNLKTFANIPLKAHTVDEIKEAVRKDNKQRFGLLEEDGELLIRANQGHTLKTVESESLLKPILSAEEVPLCVHGTYKKNLKPILESGGLSRMKRLHVHFSCGLPSDGQVISGMRRDVNVVIFLDVQKALEDGMKLYVSDNQVILTEGFEGVVLVKYFEKILSWPDGEAIPIGETPS